MLRKKCSYTLFKQFLKYFYDGTFSGSPYAIDVFKPKKLEYPVTVYGPGIHDGVLPNFESHFIVDARGAGAGELKVVLFGPKGYFL